MFYSDVILSKRGPLAKVWLAAHAERRLTKVQLLQTDIGQSVSSIIGPNGVPMALRLSGQLLLGVTRIYSRKAKYLLDDCNDALLKLKTAFRSGVTDFTTDSAHLGSHINVTLPTTRTAYDLSLPDPALEGWDAESSIAGGGDRASATSRANRYTARPADITLRRYLDPDNASNVASSFGWASGDFFDPDGSQANDQEALSSPSQRVAAALQRRDSQGRLIDENGDLIGDAEEDDVSSLGIGRDAQRPNVARPSLTVGDLTGFDSFGAGDDFLLPDVGGETALDLGLEEFDAQRRSMTPVRQASVNMDNLSPRTALKVQQAAEKRALAAQKIRKQIIDSRTQLDDNRRGGAGQRQGTQGIMLAEETLLPRSRAYMQLLELSANPSKGLLPFIDASAHAGRQQTLSTARFLAPQLSDLFTFDPALLMRNRVRALSDENDDEGRVSKRIRSTSAGGHNDDEFGSEIGRRAADVSRGDLGLGVGADVTFDDSGAPNPLDDLTFDAPVLFDDALNVAAGSAGAGPRRSQRKRNTVVDRAEQEAMEEEELRRRAFHAPGDLQRLGTPSDGSVVGSAVDTDLSPTASYPLRAFDTGTRMAGYDTQGGDAAASAAATALRISRNTSRALKVLRTHLQQDNDDEDDAADSVQPSRLQFSDVTRKASRHAAAAFFFELLALGTKDCLRIEQDESFGEIVVEAKPSLWTLERQHGGLEAS